MRIRSSWLVLLFTLLAFLLRAWRLDAFSLRGDEAFTVLFVQQPFREMWEGIRTVEPNPPLLYLLLRGWIAFAGAGEFATRYFSLFWGVLCVPLMYRLSLALLALPKDQAPAPSGQTKAPGETPAQAGLPAHVALAAAFLVAINPYQIWHSQDVRNYTLWPALSLAGLILFFGWLRSEAAPPHSGPRARVPYWKFLLPYLLVTLASLYTHYYDVFVLLAQNLFVLAVLWRRWGALFRWAAVQVVLGILYLPWPLLLSDRASAYGEGSGIQGLTLGEVARRTFSSIVLGETLPAWALAYGWIPFAVAALAVWYLVLAPRRPRIAAWLLLYAGVPTLAVWALNLYRPLFLERYLNGIAPAYYLVLAVGVAAAAGAVSWPGLPAWAPSWRISPAVPRGLAALTVTVPVLAASIALANYWYSPAHAKAPDWRSLMHTIAAQSQPGDVILQNFPEMASFYYAREGMPKIEVLPRDFLPDARTDGQLAQLATRYKRVWFIPAAPDFWDPDHFVESWLNGRTDLNSETRISTFRLRLYETALQFLPERSPLQVRIGDFAALIGYRLAREGSRTRLSLYWQPSGKTKSNYTVFVHALDREGRVIAQQDNPPVNGTRPTDGWQPGELIVDQYRLEGTGDNLILEVGMYDSRSVRLPVYDVSGAALPQDRLLIHGP